MSSLIVVHPKFDASWPWAADHWRRVWADQGACRLVRLASRDTCLDDAGELDTAATRLVVLGLTVTPAELERFENLRELSVVHADDPLRAWCEQHGVALYQPVGEGFWGQSVAEFALGLTLAGLRRIPQLHQRMQSDLNCWEYGPPGGVGRPGARGVQFGDDPRFANGTLEGKRVRIVGIGNIGSRYAQWCHQIGADVAAWDPFADEPCFHRTGARREHRLDDLCDDAEIFAPMVPLTEATRGLVTARHIEALPTGCLVVLVTRAAVCDFDALQRRVLNDELALAADVFDEEPLPLDHPLMGRDNVVHTPHNAGRTKQANEAWADAIIQRFSKA